MSQQAPDPDPIRPAREEPGVPPGEPDPDNPRPAVPQHTPGTQPTEDVPAPETQP